uniref:Nucleoside diphosphate kinase n=6 Tax=Salmoninae TaxID=504568 RepID=A0A8C8HCB1_ONCTS
MIFCKSMLIQRHHIAFLHDVETMLIQPVFAQWAPPCVKPSSAPAICIGITESTALAKITCPAPCQSLTRRISCQAFSLFSLLLISCPRSAMSNEERTFIAIKPDGVQRRLVGEIIKRFELKGFKMVGMKFVQAPESLLREHYADLEDRPFFPGLVSYMTSGPVVAMVWEGFNVVKTGRVMLGETNPADSKPGTIRGDYCIQVGRNIIHGSDSIESANTEINLWFKPEELCSYTSCSTSWLY